MVNSKFHVFLSEKRGFHSSFMCYFLFIEGGGGVKNSQQPSLDVDIFFGRKFGPLYGNLAATLWPLCKRIPLAYSSIKEQILLMPSHLGLSF